MTEILWSRPICKVAGDYLAWPTVVTCASGEVLVVFSGDREEHVCPYGKTLLIRSGDGGETWTTPVIINSTPLDDRDAGIIELTSGTLVMSWFTYATWEHFDAFPGARPLGAGADRRVGPALQQGPGRDPARLAGELDAALDRRRTHLGAAGAEHRLRPARTGAGRRRRAAVCRHRRGGRPWRGAAGHVHRRGAVVAGRGHGAVSGRLHRRAPAVPRAARGRAGRRRVAVHPSHRQRRGRDPLLPLKRPRRARGPRPSRPG